MILTDKTALVFGGASGIGRAYVEVLLKEQCKVFFVDVDKGAGEKTARELSDAGHASHVTFQSCDVSREEDISKAFDSCRARFQDLDIVVNNCGLIDEFNFNRCIQVNLVANIIIINKTIQEIGKAGGGKGGCFVATASSGGLFPVFWGPVYSATKHAVIALVRSWALPPNYDVHGVRMNCVCPYRVDTDFLKAIHPDLVYHSDLQLAYRTNHPEMIPPSVLGDGLLLILKDDSVNGRALRVSLHNGFDWEPYEQIVHPER